jgi:hypothetical protein
VADLVRAILQTPLPQLFAVLGIGLFLVAWWGRVRERELLPDQRRLAFRAAPVCLGLAALTAGGPTLLASWLPAPPQCQATAVTGAFALWAEPNPAATPIGFVLESEWVTVHQWTDDPEELSDGDGHLRYLFFVSKVDQPGQRGWMSNVEPKAADGWLFPSCSFMPHAPPFPFPKR